MKRLSDTVASLTAMTDRYPMDVEQDGMAPMVISGLAR
jgi:hypothetical protein